MPLFSRTDTTLLLAATCVLLSEWALPSQAGPRAAWLESASKPCLSAASTATPLKTSVLPKVDYCKVTLTTATMLALRGTP